MRRRAGLLILMVASLAWGCSTSERELDLSSIVGERVEPSVSKEQERWEFDFGSVLACDHGLRHDFVLPNRSNKTLKIKGGKANAPCCSGLGKLPDSIAPGGEAIIAAILKVGHVAERKRVSFEIETDSPTVPTRSLVLTARFVAEWEVEDRSGPMEPLKLGQSSPRTYRVVARRKAGEGLKAPAVVESSETLTIESVSAPVELEWSDGVIESSREVVLLPKPQPSSGEKRGSLTFRWPDGTSRVHEIRWSVKPSLVAFPAVLVLKADPTLTEVTVEIRSEDRAFRVLKVVGGLITADVAASAQSLTTQTIRIPLDLSRVVPGVRPEVEIVTDHPDQPSLRLGVLVLPPEKGKTP